MTRIHLKTHRVIFWLHLSYLIVVPTTTPAWIWPSNGKILRGPYQNFWILILMEVFGYVYMTNCSYICFRWLKAWSCMIFYQCFDCDGWLLVYPVLFWYHELNGGWTLFLFDSFWWYVHWWTHLSLYLSFTSLPSGFSLLTLFTLPMTLSTFKGLLFFTSLMSLLSQG